MKRHLLMLFTLILLFAFNAGTAEAYTLSAVDGAWSNTVGGSYVNYTTESVGYGNGSEDQVWWGTGSSDKIGLGFTGVAPPAISFNGGDSFQIGQLRYFNSPISSGSAASSTKLAISLLFSDPSGVDEIFTLDFTINEASNTAGGSGAEYSIFFPSSFPTKTFDIGGTHYALQLLGFGDTDSDIVGQFECTDSGTNATLLWGRMRTATDPIPNPEPTTMLLLGCGLIGLVGLRRKLSKR